MQWKANGSETNVSVNLWWPAEVKWTTALTHLAALLLIYLQTREQANPDMTRMCGYMITISNATFQLEMLIDSAEKHTHGRRLLDCSSHVGNQGLCLQSHLNAFTGLNTTESQHLTFIYNVHVILSLFICFTDACRAAQSLVKRLWSWFKYQDTCDHSEHSDSYHGSTEKFIV